MRHKLILTLILAACLAVPAAALAADLLYVSCSEADPAAGLPRDAVAMSKVGTKYYLFLPGAADMEALRLWTSGGMEAAVNGQVMENGGRLTGVTPGEALKVKLGKKTA